MFYPVNDIYTTIQGEGALTGTPMILLRLMGCDVGCPFCDTKETWVKEQTELYHNIEEILGTNSKWGMFDQREIAVYCKNIAGNIKWILITGGEPAQYKLNSLYNELKKWGFKIAIETSGTETGHLPMYRGITYIKADWITVSPKIGMPGKKTIKGLAIETAHELKFVVGRQKDAEDIKKILDFWEPLLNKQVISVQPMSKNEKATQICKEYSKREGWRLSIQLHKYIEER